MQFLWTCKFMKNNNFKSLAVLGTASNVGKTTIVMALCRYFSSKCKVTPFKGFNLSSQSFNKGGLEIGYAQYVQALASEQKYSPLMNPILFTTNDVGKDRKLIVKGEKSEYLSICEQKKIVDSCYSELEKQFDLIIAEGSGSCREMNLLDRDLANFTFVNSKNNMQVIIVADISKGGVFASIYGTIKLLDEEERKKVKGIVINNFDGEASAFSEGKAIIENLCEIPVIGVIPKININLPEEDSLEKDKNYDDKAISLEIDRVSKIICENIDMEKITSLLD